MSEAPSAAAALVEGAPAQTAQPAAAPAAAPAQVPAATQEPAATSAQETPDPAAVALPGPDATPDQWKTFYKALGAPESGDGYQLPVPEGGDAAFAKEAATMMAEAGLLPRQAEALAKWWNDKAAALTAAQSDQAAQAEAAKLREQHAANTADEATLRQEWGAQHDANMEAAKRAVRQFITPMAPAGKTSALVAAIEGVVGYGATMRMMHAIGKGLMTGQAHGLGGDGQQVQQPAKTLAERLYPNG